MNKEDINKNFTSIEQSKKLLDLGINPRTADCEWASDWSKFYIDGPNFGKIIDREPPHLRIGSSLSEVIPSWSLAALLDVIPDALDINGHFCLFNLTQHSAAYCDAETSEVIVATDDPGITSLTAAFKMVCWLLENDYIEKWTPFIFEDVKGFSSSSKEVDSASSSPSDENK